MPVNTILVPLLITLSVSSYIRISLRIVGIDEGCTCVSYKTLCLRQVDGATHVGPDAMYACVYTGVGRQYEVYSTVLTVESASPMIELWGNLS